MAAISEYDPVGNLKSRTDFTGKQTSYGYDALNRLHTSTPTRA
jgi:YD repeat-containing protein